MEPPTRKHRCSSRISSPEEVENGGREIGRLPASGGRLGAPVRLQVEQGVGHGRAELAPVRRDREDDQRGSEQREVLLELGHLHHPAHLLLLPPEGVHEEAGEE